ncbi:hybrid sensor histidine kinase/response regulator [Alterinioella nitratireducens]|mgnify:FL=1|uniref:hybrid sensor histidine kinase/response regulator n=3 Tax=Alterinioella nitratireducens TaxID=2735915 RepID=UPI0015564F30|nr:ATP-binding protein [Alterinioella nitratireducens]NPD21086.1 response regulator [Alterinioella nitratireducens]
MADQAVLPGKQPFRFRVGPSAGLLLLAALCLGLSFLAPGEIWRIALYVAAASITLTALLLFLSKRRARARDHALLVTAGKVAADDPVPVFCTDAAGAIIFQNRAAEDRFKDRLDQSMSRALAGIIANSSAVIFRQEAALARDRQARETVVTKRGSVRLTAFRVGPGTMWRVDETVETTGRSADWIGLPMMVVSRNDTILSMNEAMRRTLGKRMRALGDVFETLPVQTGQKTRLKGADGFFDAVTIELQAGDGRREIYALPVTLLPLEDSVAARAFEALPVALVHIAGDGRLLAANPQAQTLLNLDPGADLSLSGAVEGLGRPINDWLSDTLEERIPARPEMVRARLRDDDCFLQVTLGRITGEGDPTLLAVLHDATELKTMEQQFVQSQKMQAIGELAGGVAHDFNNLLTAITGHCDLLLLRHDQGAPDYADLVQINQNANRAASLVGQLLAFSRKQTMQPEILDLRDTMSDLTHLLNRLVGERIRLHLDHDPGLLPIRADRRQLEQVLMNLVVNARDAMPEGGDIHVETRVVHLAEPLFRDEATVPPGQYVTVEVRDEGTGIPTEQLTRIFEPFFTTKRTGEGTGLGLSMVYGIVKQSGGFIFADSRLGEGTDFVIYFPVHDLPAHPERVAQEEAPDPVAETVPHLPGDGVVLLVEDEASVRAFASRALRMRGYTVVEAESAEEALEKLADTSLSVDVFVTDVIMPGMDGPTWVREALKDRPDVKVVFVSGYAEDAFEKTGGKVPNSVFLAKPFSLSDLTSTVQRQLH